MTDQAILVSFLTLAVALPSALAAPRNQPRSTAAAAAVNCRVMASVPGGMSVEACEALLGSSNQMQQALDQSSSGVLPGDESMSCKALLAELKTMKVTPPSRSNMAEAQASNDALQAETDRIMAKGRADYAKQTAVDTATVVAGAVGIPGVGEANAAAQMAQGQRNAVRLTPLRNRALTANAALIGDTATNIKSNPRLGRLASLMMKKGCGGRQ